MGRTFWGTLDTECWVEASIQGDRADHTADSGWRGGGGGYILFPGHILGDCKEEGGERGGGHLGKD